VRELGSFVIWLICRTGVTMIVEYVGAKLSELRTKQGMSITLLSRSIDVSPHLIHRWESGAERIPADRLVEFAELLNCKISDFFGGFPELRESSEQVHSQHLSKPLDH